MDVSDAFGQFQIFQIDLAALLFALSRQRLDGERSAHQSVDDPDHMRILFAIDSAPTLEIVVGALFQRILITECVHIG